MSLISIKQQNRPFLSQLMLLLVLLCVSAMDTPAQNQPLPQWLSGEERQRIEKERGEKERTDLLLKVASVRLTNARSQLSIPNYKQTLIEIKNYGTLIDYTNRFISSLPKSEKDKKKLYKIFELVLRRDLNQLEMLVYELPQDYAEEATEVQNQVKKVRAVALGAVFGKDFFPPDISDIKPQDEK